MKELFFKIGEKILYGFGFGLGMGFAFKILPVSKYEGPPPRNFPITRWDVYNARR